MQYIRLFSIACLFALSQGMAQQPMIKVLESGKKISIRGLSVVSDKIIWASGSRGSVARSVDGGATFIWYSVTGYEKNDFRDIEAFDENTALIMGITQPAVILKTTDGGKNWKKILEDTTQGAFWDAMDFSGKEGILIGDPLGDAVYLAATQDEGETWNRLNPIRVKVNGEAFFASSGTNIKKSKKGITFFASGGKQSNIYSIDNGVIQSIPIMQGGTSTGANSMDYFTRKKKGIIVGGDYSKDTLSKNNCALFTYNKKSFEFTVPQIPPHGYRSCVIYLDKNHLITCGSSGVDISGDGGRNWQLISKESFHVCQKAKKGKTVFMAGANGRIAKLLSP